MAGAKLVWGHPNFISKFIIFYDINSQLVKFDKSHCSLYFRKMTLAYYKKVRFISLYLPFEQLNEKYTEIVISIS